MQIIRLTAAVVGTGAAGYNAAIRLNRLGVKDVAIITEGVNCGTSRNTGSDKQTYYKLGLGGDARDSVADMANDLFKGGCVDGDTALVEAALSSRSFLNLCELGVAFPTNRYGEYVGYKTDHDPFERATSAGPLTSKMMTEALEAEAKRLDIKIFDHQLVVSIIKNGDEVAGLLAVDTRNGEFTLYNCKSVVYAVGGPAGIYQDSVYPTCHHGASGVAFEAGVIGQNLTEWQYGLASIAPRWNVSGTYMQVLPRFVSVDEEGNKYEFLNEYFDDLYECLSMVFLKGYQWPFDSRKVLDGSSVIDLLVYREKIMRGRRIYLDFRTNPFGMDEIEFDKLSGEAFDYLNKAHACFGTPIERLRLMNEPAIDLYKSKGVDLDTEMLEIALCAQHNNGGLAVDAWWQTAVNGLFAAGEVAGTHGIYRPGGSALNSGQCGSLRAAQFISAKRNEEPMADAEFEKIAADVVKQFEQIKADLLKNENNLDEMIAKAKSDMSAYGAAIRKHADIELALASARERLAKFGDIIGVESESQVARAFELRDLLICQITYLSAMSDYAENYKTRGSALYYDTNGQLRDGLDEVFRFSHDGGENNGSIQQVKFGNESCDVSYRPVRPMPEGGGFFENVWRGYRENGNIY